MGNRAFRTPSARRSLRPRAPRSQRPDSTPPSELPERESHFAQKPESLPEPEPSPAPPVVHERPTAAYEPEPPAAPTRTARVPPASAFDASFESDQSARGDRERSHAAAERSRAQSVAAPTEQPRTSRLLAHPADHDDQLLAHFFSSPPSAAHDDHDGLDDDEHYQVPMSQGSRRAMFASLAIFAVSLVGIGGYTAYHQLFMPAPVELGGAFSNELVPAVAPAAVEPTRAVPPSVVAELPAPPAVPVAAVPVQVAKPATELAAAAPSVAAYAPAEQAPQPSAAAAPAPAPAEQSAPTRVAERRVAQDEVAAEVRAAPSANSADAVGTLPSYEELIEVGRTLARKGQNKQALAAYERALDTQPTAAAALAGIAFVHLNAGEKGLAKLFAERAVESDPTNSQGWIVLGAAQQLLGQRAAAREAYRRCATEAVGSYVLECRRLSPR